MSSSDVLETGNLLLRMIPHPTMKHLLSLTENITGHRVARN